MNLYGFVLNSPTNFIDLLGLIDDGKCEVVYFVGHTGEAKKALKAWNKRQVHPSRASGNGCFMDGSNGENGVGGAFVGNSVGGVGWASYCDGEDGNGGFNPEGDDTAKNRAIGYIKLLRNNWEATLKAADELAKDCSDCECETITAIIVFASDDKRYSQGGTRFGSGSTKKALKISGLQKGSVKGLNNLGKRTAPTDTPTTTMSVTFDCAKTKKSEAARKKKEAKAKARAERLERRGRR